MDVHVSSEQVSDLVAGALRVIGAELTPLSVATDIAWRHVSSLDGNRFTRNNWRLEEVRSPSPSDRNWLFVFERVGAVERLNVRGRPPVVNRNDEEAEVCIEDAEVQRWLAGCHHGETGVDIATNLALNLLEPGIDRPDARQLWSFRNCEHPGEGRAYWFVRFDRVSEAERESAMAGHVVVAGAYATDPTVTLNGLFLVAGVDFVFYRNDMFVELGVAPAEGARVDIFWPGMEPMTYRGNGSTTRFQIAAPEPARPLIRVDLARQEPEDWTEVSEAVTEFLVSETAERHPGWAPETAALGILRRARPNVEWISVPVFDPVAGVWRARGRQRRVVRDGDGNEWQLDASGTVTFGEPPAADQTLRLEYSYDARYPNDRVQVEIERHLYPEEGIEGRSGTRAYVRCWRSVGGAVNDNWACRCGYEVPVGQNTYVNWTIHVAAAIAADLVRLGALTPAHPNTVGAAMPTALTSDGRARTRFRTEVSDALVEEWCRARGTAAAGSRVEGFSRHVVQQIIEESAGMSVLYLQPIVQDPLGDRWIVEWVPLGMPAKPKLGVNPIRKKPLLAQFTGHRKEREDILSNEVTEE